MEGTPVSVDAVCQVSFLSLLFVETPGPRRRRRCIQIFIILCKLPDETNLELGARGKVKISVSLLA